MACKRVGFHNCEGASMVLLFVLLASITMTLGSNSALAQDYVPGEVIVKLKSNAGSQSRFFGKVSASKSLNLKKSFGRLKMYHYKLSKGQTVQQQIEALKSDPDVAYAEPNYIIKKQSVGFHGDVMSLNDVQALATGGAGSKSTLADIKLEEARNEVAPSSRRPIIAVIDTGLDVGHNVFVNSNAVWINPGEVPDNGVDDDGNGYVDDVNGWNFVSNTGAMIDDDNHGTHVAGTILSVVMDIFDGDLDESPIQIMPLKFLDSEGMGSTSDAIAAIEYAIENGASVLNNSWGGPSYSNALHEAVALSYNHGVSFVAAAGNAGTDNDARPMYPASLAVPNVLSIAATTNADGLATFSNYGYNTVHVGSPGVYILSTLSGGGFGYMSGTSMATPYVSGIIGLMMIQEPSLLGSQARVIIEDSAEGMSDLVGKVFTEARINAQAAVLAVKQSSIEKNQPTYDLSGERAIASEPTSQAGGCGTVSKLMNEGQRRGDRLRNSHEKGSQSGSSLLFRIVLMGVVLAPMAMVFFMRQSNPANQRRYERFKVDSSVTMTVGGQKLIGQVSSISMGGAQVNTEALLEHGGVVKMSIEAPDGSGSIEVEGKVVWSKERESYGVQFSEVTDGIKTRLSGWTSSLSSS